MMHQIAMQEITNKDYSTRRFSSPSTSMEKIDEIDLLVDTSRGKRAEKPLNVLFETDLSSISQDIKIKVETSVFERMLNNELPKDIPEIEYDIIVRIPPKKRWYVSAKVMSVGKAKPCIVEPEEF